MSLITTHVLDVSLGHPASEVPVVLEYKVSDDAGPEAARWEVIGKGVTDSDGRIRTLVPAGTELRAGTYQLTFDTGAYFVANGVQSFYPSVTVAFAVRDASAHYHVPLLLSPFGYSTYRGS